MAWYPQLQDIFSLLSTHIPIHGWGRALDVPIAVPRRHAPGPTSGIRRNNMFPFHQSQVRVQLRCAAAEAIRGCGQNQQVFAGLTGMDGARPRPALVTLVIDLLAFRCVCRVIDNDNWFGHILSIAFWRTGI
jgi:hypothetical protein